MSQRFFVSGVTATLELENSEPDTLSEIDTEYYHEIEIYRQLIALRLENRNLSSSTSSTNADNHKLENVIGSNLNLEIQQNFEILSAKDGLESQKNISDSDMSKNINNYSTPVWDVEQTKLKTTKGCNEEENPYGCKKDHKLENVIGSNLNLEIQQNFEILSAKDGLESQKNISDSDMSKNINNYSTPVWDVEQTKLKTTKGCNEEENPYGCKKDHKLENVIGSNLNLEIQQNFEILSAKDGLESQKNISDSDMSKNINNYSTPVWDVEQTKLKTTKGCNEEENPYENVVVVGKRKSTFRHLRPVIYLGSFPVAGEEFSLSDQLCLMKSGRSESVLLMITTKRLKVCRPHDQSVRMSHALPSVMLSACDASRALFAFVSRSPDACHHRYCHAFSTHTSKQAEELNSLVGDAFRMAFTSQRKSCTTPWCAEPEQSGRMMCVRAPSTLLLQHPFPRTPSRPDSKCSLSGSTPLVEESSPSSGEEWSCGVGIGPAAGYRRLGGGGGVMRRLRGFGGMAHLDDEDDSTPLVSDTPTTPTTHMPSCLAIVGGYINEASSDAELRIRDTNNEHIMRNAVPTAPDNLIRNEMQVKKRLNKDCASSASCSVSSGASSSGSGNNNRLICPYEPELRDAPWFHAGIPREVAEEALSGCSAGAFLIRGASRGGLALSLRAPAQRDHTRGTSGAIVQHYLIHRTPRGYRIKGFTKDFPTLKALVTHHSVMPELLPCPLWLDRTHVPRRDHADLERIPERVLRRENQKFSCSLDV